MTTNVTLSDAIVNVSLAGYLRAKGEGCRNVHAWVIGTVIAIDSHPDLTGLAGVTYQPKPRAPASNPIPASVSAITRPNITAAGLVVCAKPALDARHGYAWIPCPVHPPATPTAQLPRRS